jgi:hypothetical protein
MNDADISFYNRPAERDGGVLARGLFLREFVPGGVRWAHLDIAEPAFNTGEAYGYTRQRRDRRGDADPGPARGRRRGRAAVRPGLQSRARHSQANHGAFCG